MGVVLELGVGGAEAKGAAGSAPDTCQKRACVEARQLVLNSGATQATTLATLVGAAPLKCGGAGQAPLVVKAARSATTLDELPIRSDLSAEGN